MDGSMVKLNTPTSVTLHIDEDNIDFDSEQDSYFNIPLEYYKQAKGKIKLNKEIAVKLDWIVYEEINGTANITTRAQTINIDGVSRDINPGLGGLVEAKSLHG